MSLIDFFAPIIYNNQIKTIPEQTLETIDEYFYLGDKFCVTIFAPDEVHPQSWAMQNRQDRHRPWINIAIKIASYSTVILPLVALLVKAILRCYLQVSSIQVKSFVPSSRIEAKMSTEQLRHISSFLIYQDQAQLGQVCIFLRDETRVIQQYYVDLMAPLKTEIEALPAGPLADEDFQGLFVKLVTSPAAGHPKHWGSVIDALMGHLPPNDTVNSIIKKHAKIFELLATSEKTISPDQIYLFCRYLGRGELSKIMPWISYRALEQYSLKRQLNSVSVNKALKEYLTQQAKMHIKARHDDYFLGNNEMFEFQITDIDPRKWFGFETAESSLWLTQNGEIVPMPELLLEVLWSHIQSLRNSYLERPFMVDMTGSVEAQLPWNFILTLVQRIRNADIFLDINIEEIEKHNYARRLGDLNTQEKRELAAERYPNAVVTLD